jgi:AraC-like DNA-binding protein
MDDVPERDRFDSWDAMLQSTIGMSARPLADPPGPFQANLSLRSSGPLFNLTMEADAHCIARETATIAQRHLNAYWVYREVRAGARITHAADELVATTGNLIIADADVPCEVRPMGRYGHSVLLVPKPVLDPYLRAPGRPMLRLLSGLNGVEALASGYLDALARNWDGIGAETMGMVADTLCRLIGVACGAAAADQPNAVRAGRLAEAKRLIDRSLTVPDLSAVWIAASLGISVRMLHLLFEPTGSSFARYVLRRRLEECRAALLADPTRPVIDIAFAWGFGSLSSFYRAFQTAFGMAPGDLREASCEAKSRAIGLHEMRRDLHPHGSRLTGVAL